MSARQRTQKNQTWRTMAATSEFSSCVQRATFYCVVRTCNCMVRYSVQLLRGAFISTSTACCIHRYNTFGGASESLDIGSETPTSEAIRLARFQPCDTSLVRKSCQRFASSAVISVTQVGRPN